MNKQLCTCLLLLHLLPGCLAFSRSRSIGPVRMWWRSTSCPNGFVAECTTTGTGVLEWTDINTGRSGAFKATESSVGSNQTAGIFTAVLTSSQGNTLRSQLKMLHTTATLNTRTIMCSTKRGRNEGIQVTRTVSGVLSLERPFNLAANRREETQASVTVHLSWLTNNDQCITGYYVEVTGTRSSNTFTFTTNQQNEQVTLTPNDVCAFRVRSIADHVQGQWSDTLSFNVEVSTLPAIQSTTVVPSSPAMYPMTSSPVSSPPAIQSTTVALSISSPAKHPMTSLQSTTVVPSSPAMYPMSSSPVSSPPAIQSTTVIPSSPAMYPMTSSPVSSPPAIQSTTVVPSSPAMHPSIMASGHIPTSSTPTSTTIPALSATFNTPEVTQIIISLLHDEEASSQVLIRSTSSSHTSSHSSPDILSITIVLPQQKGAVEFSLAVIICTAVLCLVIMSATCLIVLTANRKGCPYKKTNVPNIAAKDTVQTTSGSSAEWHEDQEESLYDEVDTYTIAMNTYSEYNPPVIDEYDMMTLNSSAVNYNELAGHQPQKPDYLNPKEHYLSGAATHLMDTLTYQNQHTVVQIPPTKTSNRRQNVGGLKRDVSMKMSNNVAYSGTTKQNTTANKSQDFGMKINPAYSASGELVTPSTTPYHWRISDAPQDTTINPAYNVTKK